MNVPAVPHIFWENPVPAELPKRVGHPIRPNTCGGANNHQEISKGETPEEGDSEEIYERVLKNSLWSGFIDNHPY